MMALIQLVSASELSDSPSFLNQHSKAFTVNNTEDKDRMKLVISLGLSCCTQTRTCVFVCGELRQIQIVPDALVQQLQRGASEGSTQPPDQYLISQLHDASPSPDVLEGRITLRTPIILIGEK